jgi:butyryl-CoA dehydrogenase
MLSDEHRLLRDSLRDFAQQRLAPFAAEWDRGATFPKQALAELAALGTFGIAVPDHYGGAGMDYLALASRSRRSPPATARPRRSSASTTARCARS